MNPVKLKKSRYHKYELYECSVQAAEDDVPFLARIYKRERSKLALSFREDFCGTFVLCSEWVKSHKERSAVGVDISTIPTRYGFENHLTKLSDDQKKRLKIFNRDVRKVGAERFDFICALNFSYFIFKSRDLLRDYFKSALKSLAKEGVFLVDHFGGPANMNPQKEMRECEALNGKKFRYYWEQETFNPITNEAKFHIHFSTPDRVRMNRAFSYDWRMWSVPEVREIMLEAGFKSTKVYWEYNGEDFRPSEKGEDDCDVWICYIVGLV
jgi:hypothetical protein